MEIANQEKVIRLQLPANFKYLNVLGACVGAMLDSRRGIWLIVRSSLTTLS